MRCWCLAGLLLMRLYILNAVLRTLSFFLIGFSHSGRDDIQVCRSTTVGPGEVQCIRHATCILVLGIGNGYTCDVNNTVDTGCSKMSKIPSKGIILAYLTAYEQFTILNFILGVSLENLFSSENRGCHTPPNTLDALGHWTERGSINGSPRQSDVTADWCALIRRNDCIWP